jgi:hypothetical protein
MEKLDCIKQSKISCLLGKVAVRESKEGKNKTIRAFVKKVEK